jgi:hypothetical protein
MHAERLSSDTRVCKGRDEINDGFQRMRMKMKTNTRVTKMMMRTMIMMMMRTRTRMKMKTKMRMKYKDNCKDDRDFSMFVAQT